MKIRAFAIAFLFSFIEVVFANTGSPDFQEVLDSIGSAQSVSENEWVYSEPLSDEAASAVPLKKRTTGKSSFALMGGISKDEIISQSITAQGKLNLKLAEHFSLLVSGLYANGDDDGFEMSKVELSMRLRMDFINSDVFNLYATAGGYYRYDKYEYGYWQNVEESKNSSGLLASLGADLKLRWVNISVEAILYSNKPRYYYYGSYVHDEKKNDIEINASASIPLCDSFGLNASASYFSESKEKMLLGGFYLKF